MKNITFFIKNPFGKYFNENLNLFSDFCSSSELFYSYVINASYLSTKEKNLYKKYLREVNILYSGEHYSDYLNQYIRDFVNGDPDLVIISDCDHKITRDYLIKFILDIELSRHEASFESKYLYAFKVKSNDYTVHNCENDIVHYAGTVVDNGRFRKNCPNYPITKKDIDILS